MDEMKDLKELYEKMVDAVKHEFNKGIENVDCHEMSESIDMIKDLAEACYYKSITKAMEESEAEYGKDYDEMGMYEREPKYYRGQPRSKTSGRFMSRYDGRRSYPEVYNEMRDMDRMDGRMYYSEPMSYGNNERHPYEGKSGMMRKSYMEKRELHNTNSVDDNEFNSKEAGKWIDAMGDDIKEAFESMSSKERAVTKQKLLNIANNL